MRYVKNIVEKLDLFKDFKVIDDVPQSFSDVVCWGHECCIKVDNKAYFVIYSDIITNAINPNIGDNIYIWMDNIFTGKITYLLHGKTNTLTSKEVYEEISNFFIVDGNIKAVDLLYIGKDLYIILDVYWED